jgi:hypothetical protein
MPVMRGVTYRPFAETLHELAQERLQARQLGLQAASIQQQREMAEARLEQQREIAGAEMEFRREQALGAEARAEWGMGLREEEIAQRAFESAREAEARKLQEERASRMQEARLGASNIDLLRQSGIMLREDGTYGPPPEGTAYAEIAAQGAEERERAERAKEEQAERAAALAVRKEEALLGVRRKGKLADIEAGLVVPPETPEAQMERFRAEQEIRAEFRAEDTAYARIMGEIRQTTGGIQRLMAERREIVASVAGEPTPDDTKMVDEEIREAKIARGELYLELARLKQMRAARPAAAAAPAPTAEQAEFMVPRQPAGAEAAPTAAPAAAAAGWEGEVAGMGIPTTEAAADEEAKRLGIKRPFEPAATPPTTPEKMTYEWWYEQMLPGDEAGRWAGTGAIPTLRRVWSHLRAGTLRDADAAAAWGKLPPMLQWRAAEEFRRLGLIPARKAEG